MKRFFNISTTALALALVVLLAACDPPKPPQPEDPTPVVPDPVETVTLLDGEWSGAFSFADQDAFGNVEEQVFAALLTVEYIQYSGAITGEMLLDTDDEICSVGGTQVDTVVNLTVYCDGLNAFSMSGSVEEGRFSGSYVTTNLVIIDGNFVFSYVGGE